MDISELQGFIFLALVLILVAVGMKFGASLVGNFLFRQKKKTAFRSSFALAAPRGEFSIVIVKVGIDLGVVSSFLFPLIGIITIITTFFSPFLIRAGDKIIPKLTKE